MEQLNTDIVSEKIHLGQWSLNNSLKQLDFVSSFLDTLINEFDLDFCFINVKTSHEYFSLSVLYRLHNSIEELEKYLQEYIEEGLIQESRDVNNQSTTLLLQERRLLRILNAKSYFNINLNLLSDRLGGELICTSDVELSVYQLDKIKTFINRAKYRLESELDRYLLNEKINKLEFDRRKMMRMSRLGEYTSDITHKMNNAVFALDGTISICLDYLEKDNIVGLKTCLDKQIQYSQKLKNQLQKIRTFSKFNCRDRGLFSLTLLCQETIGVFAKVLKQEKINLIERYSSTNTLVTINYEEIQQVIIAILKNIIQSLCNQFEKNIRLTVKKQETEFEVLIECSSLGPNQEIIKVNCPENDFIFSAIKNYQGKVSLVESEYIDGKGIQILLPIPKKAILEF